MGKFDLVKTFENIEKKTKVASIRALNRAVKSAFSATSKFIRDDYNIKKEDLDRYVKLIPATLIKDYATLIVNRKPIALIKFKAKQRAFGVSAQVKRTSTELIKHAFITNVKGGDKLHKGVFIRTGRFKIAAKGNYKGKRREIIKELWGASPMNLLKSEEAQKFLNEKFLERFNVELERQINYEMQK